MFRPLFFSVLSPLSPGKPVEPLLDYVVATGFNGVRVFGGELNWDGITNAQAIAALPRFLDLCRQRGLYVEVSCITHSPTRADQESHLRAIADIVRSRDHILLEVANEPWSQEGDLTPGRLRELRPFLPADIPTALGAGDLRFGSLADYAGGNYTTIHLDRGGDRWAQVAALKEQCFDVAQQTGKPCSNDEPMPSGEPGDPGQQITDPAFFFGLGAVSRLLDCPVTFISQDGIFTRFPVGPLEDQSAKGLVHAWRTVDGYLRGGVGTLETASVVDRFDSGRARTVYASTNGPTGALVIVGGDDPGIVRLRSGWRYTGATEALPGCRVLELTR